MLDGLRGLAIAIVVLSHLTNSTYLPRPGLLGAGKSGVYLFFVLSAFLLTSGLLHRPAGQLAAPRTWADYALRRVLRIWPLYLVVLVASWALTRTGVGFWPYPMPDSALRAHVLLQEGRSVLWSIPVEFKFYLALPVPVLLFAAIKRMRRPLLWTGVAAAAALAAALSVWPPSEAAANDIRLGPYLVIFLCGAVAAQLDSHLPSGAVRVWGAIGAVALLALVATVPWPVSLLGGSEFAPGVNHRWFLFFGIAWSALLLAVLRGPHWLRRPFESRPLRLLGAISFSMYLWHMPVIETFTALGGLNRAGALPVVLVSVCAVSAVSFLIFERPFRYIRLQSASPAG